MKNKLKEKVRAGQLVSILWSMLGSLAARNHDFDGVLVCGEHNQLTVPQLIALSNEFTAANGIIPRDVEFLVRVVEPTRAILQHLADGAVGGIRNFVVPMVNTAEAAERAVKLLLYPPDGERGAAGGMPCNIGGADQHYFLEANRNTLLIVQAETPEAMGNLEEIIEVPGVDLVFVGPMDLHVTSGKGFRTNDPELRAQIKQRVNRIQQRQTNSRFGIMEPDPTEIPGWVTAGFGLIAVPDSVLLNKALAAHCTAVHNAFSDFR